MRDIAHGDRTEGSSAAARPLRGTPPADHPETIDNGILGRQGVVRHARTAPGLEGTAPPVRSRPRLVRWLLPSGVRVWHFILVPAVGMAIVLWGFRHIDPIALPWFAALGEPDLYVTVRSIGIGLIMASLIAVLAIEYRTEYEEQLRHRNDALERTRDFLSRIIGGSAEGIVTRDADGRITSWNPAAETIYGWSEQEMLGGDVDRVVPGADARLELAVVLKRVAAGETVRDFETRRVRKDGRAITVRMTMTPLHDGSGRFIGTSTFVRDVTDLKAMEARLLERERLAAVGELAAMVAHEVRNPLAGIRGGCEILLEGYPAGEAKHDIGEEIIRQVDRLNRTVHDLLAFARPKAADPVPTDLHALMDRVIGNLRQDPATQGVTVERSYDPAFPIVAVDARQIEQVLINLLQNAFQAIGHRGTVSLATRANGDRVEIAVRDSGAGIAQDKMEHIFKPFFTTRSQGSGLGLAIVKKIVEAHGGAIRVESPPSGGALFTVALPR
jgi:PAS domain S-box-containing protein